MIAALSVKCKLHRDTSHSQTHSVIKKSYCSHTCTQLTERYHTQSDEGSDSPCLMLLTEMIRVLKVLNTIILFCPSPDLSSSPSPPTFT